MRQIYTALIERLHSIPALKYIDMDTGQLEVPFGETSRPPVAYPAALLSLSISRESDLTEQSQVCRADITVLIADDTHRRTAAHQRSEERSRSLEIYDLIEEVRECLQGFTGGEKFGPLSRRSQGRERTSSGLFVYRLTFDTTFRQ